MTLSDTAVLPAPTPVPLVYSPEAVEQSAGYGAFLPTEPAAPHDEAFADVFAITRAAITDLAGVAPEDIERETGRRVQTHLADFRSGAVKVADLRAAAQASIAQEVHERRHARSTEVRQQIADALAAGAMRLQAAAEERRAVKLPAIGDPMTEADPARAQLLATARQTDSNLRVLAALEVTDTTAPEVLLARMTADGNPHAMQRAEATLRALLPALKAQIAAARVSGDAATVARLTAIVTGFDASVEARVAPSVRAAEQVEARAWQQFNDAARRVVLLLNIADKAGPAMSAPLVPAATAERVTAAMTQARTALREAWAPVLADVRAARLARTPAQVRG
jgi:hypothetical protein